MSLAVHRQLDRQARPYVPTMMASKLAYSQGVDPVSKHHIRSGNGRWAGGCEVGRLNPRPETKIEGTNREVSEGKAVS